MPKWTIFFVEIIALLLQSRSLKTVVKGVMLSGHDGNLLSKSSSKALSKRVHLHLKMRVPPILQQ